MLAMLRPFVSKKAGRKIRLVETLAEIGNGTGGEMVAGSLGAAFCSNSALVAGEGMAAAQP